MRVFKYKDHTFLDPGQEFTAADVLNMVAASIPELAGGSVEESDEGDDDGNTVYTFEPKPKRLG